MAETITLGSLLTKLSATVGNGSLALPISVVLPSGASQTDQFDATGTAPACKVTQLHYSERTLAASGTETLDLTSGLTSIFGTPINLTKLKFIAIFLAASPAGAGLTVAPGASNGLAVPFGGATAYPVWNGPAGGEWVQKKMTAAGFTVDATHKTILITNTDGSLGATYRLAIGGE